MDVYVQHFFKNKDNLDETKFISLLTSYSISGGMLSLKFTINYIAYAIPVPLFISTNINPRYGECD